MSNPVFTWSNSGKDNVPPGAYKVEHTGVEPSPPKDYGPGLAWRFKILNTEHAGKVISSITGLTQSPKNACGKMLMWLLGRQPVEGEKIDPAQFVGKKYIAIMIQGDKGTKLGGLTPDDKPAPF